MLDSPTTAMTVQAWINPQPLQVTRGFVFSRRDPTVSEGFSIAVVNDGRLEVVVRTTTSPTISGSVFGSPTSVVTFGQLQHIAATVDTTTGTVKAYVNGQEVPLMATFGPATVSGSLFNVNNLFIGRRQTNATVDGVEGGAHFKGRIDDVELCARVLSGTEINALYTAGGRKDLTADFLAPPSEYSTLKRNPDGTYIRTMKDGTSYQFNVQGLQTSMADRNGNTTTYGYNGSNQLTTITDPAGQVTTLSYSGNRLATITDPVGRVTTFTHDSAGNLITVNAADQTHQTFAYDAQHRMTQRTDARNQVYAYQFDHAGRLQRATLPGGAFREIRPTELTAVPNLAAGQGTPGNPATITQPPIVQATFKDAKGQTTTFETDAIGRVTKQIDPLNRTTTIARDPQGNPLVITRPNGAVTTMTYDAKGNLLTSTEQSIASTTSFTYEPTFNQVTRITDPKGNQTNITYDAKGNPLTITDADNKVTTFTYNAQGLLLTM